jgi:hypothetical protein
MEHQWNNIDRKIEVLEESPVTLSATNLFGTECRPLVWGAGN